MFVTTGRVVDLLEAFVAFLIIAGSVSAYKFSKKNMNSRTLYPLHCVIVLG
jgi:hypothetical protein